MVNTFRKLYKKYMFFFSEVVKRTFIFIVYGIAFVQWLYFFIGFYLLSVEVVNETQPLTYQNESERVISVT